MEKTFDSLCARNPYEFGDTFNGYIVNGRTGYVVSKIEKCRLRKDARSNNKYTLQYKGHYTTLEKKDGSDTVGTYTSSTNYNSWAWDNRVRTIIVFLNKKEAFDFAMNNIKKIRRNLNKRIVELNNFLIED